jgi:hypothetical protein
MSCRECQKAKTEVSESRAELLRLTRVAIRTERTSDLQRAADAKARLQKFQAQAARHQALEHA